MKMKMRLYVALVALVLAVPVLAQTVRREIKSVAYSCRGNETNIAVTLTDGTENFQGFRCDDEAVAEQVARQFNLPYQYAERLQRMVRRSEEFTVNPIVWAETNWKALIAWVVAGIALVGILLANIWVVRQQTGYIVERLGKYARTLDAGLRFKIPFIERVAHEFDLRQQQEPVNVDTKTADNVFLKVGLAVQFKVVDPRKAYYELADFSAQLKAYVFDEVRAAIPEMSFDDVFKNKEQLAERVRKALTEKMASFGYQIIDVLVTDITPPDEIQAAMNQVVTQQRLLEANRHKGEAEKVLVIAAAEAKKAQEKLHGEGIAAFRDAIADGTKKAMAAIKAGAEGLSDEEVSALLLATQYFDTLKEVAEKSRTSTLFLPSGAGASGDVMTQVLTALTATRREKSAAAPAAS